MNTITIPEAPTADTAAGERHRLEALRRTPDGWIATCSCSTPDDYGFGAVDFTAWSAEEAVAAWTAHEEEARGETHRAAAASVLGEGDVQATMIRRQDGQFLLIVGDSGVVLDAAAWAKLRTVR